MACLPSSFCPSRLVAPGLRRRTRAGFSLVEMLVVVGVIVVLMVLVGPAFRSISGANDVSRAISGVATSLAQARTYAMAHNTYVYWAAAEVDAQQPENANPQVPATATIGGRLAVAAFASRDGTRGYSVLDPAASWQQWYASAEDGTARPPGDRLTLISQLTRFENIHLAALPNPGSGAMHRPDLAPSAGSLSYQIGAAGSDSVTPIAYPLGSALGSGQYQFTKVISFDPRGVARLQGSTNGDEVTTYIEIGLQPTHGRTIPAPPQANAGQQAALQIDCMTGTIHIYRP